MLRRAWAEVMAAGGKVALGYLTFALLFLVGSELLLAAYDSSALRIAARLSFILISSALLIVWTTSEMRSRRQLSERVAQSQRLESLGKLAGGVAHDFNNLLTVINGYSELVLRRLPADDPSRADLEAVRRAGDQARNLVDQLLILSQRRVGQAIVIDVDEAILNLVEVLRRLVGNRIDVEVAATSQARVMMDRSQLEQVVLNLVVNARDAMPDGGRLSIETAKSTLDDGETAAVRVSVTDTGVGMDPTVSSRVFEPFFTTKGRADGTGGLGLATVYAAVQQAGGTVAVASAPDLGTTFTVRIPTVQGAAQPVAVRNEFDGGSERVLLVEDETEVRHYARQVLVDHGYSVTEAPSAREALLLVERAPRFDVLVTDVVMPGMGGVGLAHRVAVAAPGVPVLFMSGFAEDQEMRDLGDVHFIPKPFRPGELLHAVRQAIDTTPAPALIERRATPRD